jgi:DNA-binding FadR family transcriptional regulator
VIGTAVTRPAGPDVDAIDDVRSALVTDIVAGDLVGPITRGQLARRHKISSAALHPTMLELQDLGLLAGEGSRLRVSEEDSWRLFAPPVFQELNQPRGREAISAYMDARRCVDPTLCTLAAARRGPADVIELSQAVGSISAARESSDLHRGIRAYQAGNDRLREAIARAARNRYLAAVSERLHRHLRDAEWAIDQALRSSATAALIETLTNAILRGDAKEASHAAHAEIDLFESWSWRRLADLGRKR